MNLRNPSLHDLTGLTHEDLADVLAANPRAYMAVKGAVAEVHLYHLLVAAQQKGEIRHFRRGRGDMEKDFYVILSDGREVTVECKNVQAIPLTGKADQLSYLRFVAEDAGVAAELLRLYEQHRADLVLPAAPKKRKAGSTPPKRPQAENRPVPALPPASTWAEALNALEQAPAWVLTNRFWPLLDQRLRESGLHRYSFSASLARVCDITKADPSEFLQQFDPRPITIDFQRTRNQLETGAVTAATNVPVGSEPAAETAVQPKNDAGRYYHHREVDVIAACLFSRTLQWQFLFRATSTLPRHTKYTERFANKVRLWPGRWATSISDCFAVNQPDPERSTQVPARTTSSTAPADRAREVSMAPYQGRFF